MLQPQQSLVFEYTIKLLAEEGEEEVEKPAVKKIYKWVDKDGNTHYSDKPPKDKRIKAKPQNLDNMNIIQKQKIK